MLSTHPFARRLLRAVITARPGTHLARLTSRVTGLAMQLLLAPIVLVIIPAAFALAWLHEALADLALADRAAPQRVVLPVLAERPSTRLTPR